MLQCVAAGCRIFNRSSRAIWALRAVIGFQVHKAMVLSGLFEAGPIPEVRIASYLVLLLPYASSLASDPRQPKFWSFTSRLGISSPDLGGSILEKEQKHKDLSRCEGHKALQGISGLCLYT